MLFLGDLFSAVQFWNCCSLSKSSLTASHHKTVDSYYFIWHSDCIWHLSSTPFTKFYLRSSMAFSCNFGFQGSLLRSLSSTFCTFHYQIYVFICLWSLMYLSSSYYLLLIIYYYCCSVPYPHQEIRLKRRWEKRKKKKKRTHPITYFPVYMSSLEIQKHLCKYEIWQKVQDFNFLYNSSILAEHHLTSYLSFLLSYHHCCFL